MIKKYSDKVSKRNTRNEDGQFKNTQARKSEEAFYQKYFRVRLEDVEVELNSVTFNRVDRQDMQKMVAFTGVVGMLQDAEGDVGRFVISGRGDMKKLQEKLTSYSPNDAVLADINALPGMEMDATSHTARPPSPRKR